MFDSLTTLRVTLLMGEEMRIQFDIPVEKAAELEKLMDTIGVSTKKDLFNNALTLLEWAVKEIQSNPDRIIGSIDEKKDSYKEVQMAAFSNARSKAMASRLNSI